MAQVSLAAVLLVMGALGVARGWVWRSLSDAGRYDRKFLFHGYPPILCGGQELISLSPWGGPADVRVRLPTVHEEYCKVSLPRGWRRRPPVGRLLRDLALGHGLPAPVKYDSDDGGLVYRMDWPDFECVDRTNISEAVFDFVIVEAAPDGERSRCNFVLPLFGPMPLVDEESAEDDEEGSEAAGAIPSSPVVPAARPHTGALVLGLRGLPDAVCRPLEEPALQADDADFFEPAFRAHRLADVPLVCQFRLHWDAWLRGVSTHALLSSLAQDVDVSIADYDPSDWSVPDVSFPYVGCGAAEDAARVFTVTGPSGRAAACWFVPNDNDNSGPCHREQLDAFCPHGYSFLSDGRCCAEGA